MQSLRAIFMFIVVAATLGAYFMPGGLASRPDSKPNAQQVADGYASLFAPKTAMDQADPDGDPNDPASYLRNLKPIGLATTGWQAFGPILSLEGGTAAFISDVFHNYRSLDRTDQPARIIGYTPSPKQCEVMAPDPDSYVAHIHVARNKNFSGFYPAQQQMRSDPVFGGFLNPSRAIAEGFRTVDIAVTHVAEPVHVVLSSGANFALWNFHLMQDAHISRVTVLGGGVHAFANLTDHVQIEQIAYDPDGRRCFPEKKYPWATSPYSGKAFPGFDEHSQQEARKGYTAKQQAYATWFTAQFGVSPFERYAGWDNAQAVLIGPMPTPDARISFVPLSSSTLLTPQNKSLYSGRTRASQKLFIAAKK